MEYSSILFISTSILIIGIIIFFFFKIRKWRRKRKEKLALQYLPPQDVLDDFNYAENKLKGGIHGKFNQTENPYSVLWEIAKRNRTGEPANSDGTAEQTISNGELCSEPVRRKDIQTGIATSISEDAISSRRNKQNNIRSFIRRVRESGGRK